MPWRGNAFDLVKSIPRIIVRGPAGSGKTTLLQWFISKCDPFHSQVQQSGLETFPIYIPLRRIESLHLDDWSVKNVVYSTLSSGELGRRFPSNLFSYLKQNGLHYTFLMDGVDELSEYNRDRFWRFVENILTMDPTARVIITSRNLSVAHLSTGEYRDDIYQSQESFRAAAYQWRPPSGFLEFVVLPLTNEEIVQFIDQWHFGLDEQLLPASNRAELSTFPKKLRGELFVPDNRSALELCRTPILCALICMTFFLGGGRLPRSKRSLYEMATRLLVETRDEYRGIKLPEKFEGLTGSKRIDLLRRVALLMQEGLDPDLSDQSLEIDKSKLIEFIANWIADTGFEGVEPKEIAAFLIDRCSIIREPVNQRVDFIHRSFMEYLASNEAVIRRNSHSLRSRIAHDQWLSTLQFMMDTPTGGVFFAGQLISDMITYVGERYKTKKSFLGRPLYLRIASLLGFMPEVPNSFHDQIATLASLVLPPHGHSDIADCLGIPFQFLRGPLAFEKVNANGPAAVSLSGELLARHEDHRCADILKAGYENVADQEVIYLINRAGRIPFVEHHALIARILNGSYKKKIFFRADEMNNKEISKLIGRDIGIRFPILSKDLAGWANLKKCFDVTFIGAKGADWDKLLRGGCTFDACRGLELEECSDFDFETISKLFPKIEYAIIDNCDRASVDGLENCTEIESIEFRNIFNPIELNKWPRSLKEVILVNCGQQGLAPLEMAGLKVIRERSAPIFY
jgi:NACHT domain